MTNLDNILKTRDITLLTNILLVKTMAFPVVMYGWESWTIKKAELWRIDAFELWWRRLFRVPWTSTRSNQSILKEISPAHSLEGLMLKLELQYFGHLMWRTDSLEKTLMLGKKAGGERDDGWIVSVTRWTWVWASSGSWWWTGKPGVLQSMGLQWVGHDWMSELKEEVIIWIQKPNRIYCFHFPKYNCTVWWPRFSFLKVAVTINAFCWAETWWSLLVLRAPEGCHGPSSMTFTWHLDLQPSISVSEPCSFPPLI